MSAYHLKADVLVFYNVLSINKIRNGLLKRFN